MIRNKHSERELLQEIQRLQAELEVLRASDSIRQEQHLQRLQILHEIDHAILSSQDEAETALIALRSGLQALEGIAHLGRDRFGQPILHQDPSARRGDARYRLRQDNAGIFQHTAPMPGMARALT